MLGDSKTDFMMIEPDDWVFWSMLRRNNSLTSTDIGAEASFLKEN